MARKEDRNDGGVTPQAGTTRTDRPVITVDYEKYAHFLEHADLNEDQKREFVQTLWNIIVEFVSLGFGVHPLQQAHEACGQIDETREKPPISGPDEVKSKADILTKNFSGVVDPKADSAA